MSYRTTALLAAFWLLFGAGPLAYAQPAEAPPGVQIITAEEIAQAGITRLSDLFALLDGWYATSVEGFAWDASAGGLASAQEAAWTLLVDGQPVDLTALDAQNINRLPLAPSAIEYVEAIRVPAVVAGVLARGGVLHLHTRRPEAGVGVQASFAAGNEVGDPGPFRYTAFSSPNIDRIGPTFRGRVAASGRQWHVRAHGLADEFHATDTRIVRRVRSLYFGEKAPRLLQAGAGLDAAVVNTPVGTHRVFAAFSRLQDLPFYEPLGREAPTDVRLYHAGLAGSFFPESRAGLRYRISYTINDLDPRVNTGRLDFNWRQNALRGHYEVYAATRRLDGALGLSFEQIESFTGGPLTDPTVQIPRAYGRLAFTAKPRVRPSLTAYVSRAEGAAGFGVLGTLALHPHPQHHIQLHVAAMRTPYAAENRWWFWVPRGYSFFQNRGVALSLPGSFAAATRYTADAAWRVRFDDRTTLTFSGALRRLDDLTLARYDFAYDSLTTALDARTAVQGGLSGRVLSAGAELRVKLLPSLEHRFHYTYLRYPTDDDAFFEAWRSQPWHRLRYTVRYTPLDRLSLYARLAYTSETFWPAYNVAARDGGGLYESRLPGFWLLDLSAQKRFWRDHFAVSLSLRNFLNEPYRTHPAGAVTQMVFEVRLQAYLHRGRASGQ